MTLAPAVRPASPRPLRRPCVGRAPALGTNVGLVFASVSASERSAASPEVIASRTGLTPSQVRRALRALVELGYWSPPTPAESREARQQAQFAAWDSVWPTIAPYAELRMTPLEIQLAVAQAHGQRISVHRIEHALRHASHVGRLAPRTDAERRSARGAAFLPADQRAAYVRAWLAVRDMLEAEDLASAPRSRNDWAALIDAYAGNRSRLDAPSGKAQAVLRLARQFSVGVGLSDGCAAVTWQEIAPFASLRLSPREIAAALQLARGVDRPTPGIATELHLGRRRGRIPQPTVAERRDVRLHVSLASATTVQHQVGLQLDAAALVLGIGRWPWPTDRMAWAELTATLNAQGILTDRAMQWQLVERLYRRTGVRLAELADPEAVVRARDTLAAACRAELAGPLGLSGERIPDTRTEQWLLVALAQAWRRYLCTQDRTQLEALRHFCARYDPTFSQRLHPQVTQVVAAETAAWEAMEGAGRPVPAL